MWLTAVMMVVEIAAGWFYNSMALLADGFHMSSHTVAIGLSAFAYAAARNHTQGQRFAFGTWKIEILGGFASAIFLLMVAALMVYGSIERLFRPEVVHYQEALLIALLGLAVNLISARVLGQAHHHDHDPGRGHNDPHGHHQDLNWKSAYVHVITDAATSVAAIAALAGGWMMGWSWLDPVMGLVGAVVVALWAKCLIADLHVWRVGQGSYSCALSVVTQDAQLTPQQVRQWLAVHEEIVHSTIEIHRFQDG